MWRSRRCVRRSFAQASDRHGAAYAGQGGLARMASRLLADVARKRNGGRHRCQPPLSGFIPRTALHTAPVCHPFGRPAAKRCVAACAGTIRRRFGRPPFGGRPHLKSPSSSRPCLCRNSCPFKAMDCFSVPGRVRFNSWESLRSVIKLSIEFLVNPARYLLASLATTLRVPAAFRLCRPMI